MKSQRTTPRSTELNYPGKFGQYFAPPDSQSSFLRWAVDLATPTTECAPTGDFCPEIREPDLGGSLVVRLLLSEPLHSAGSAVPFYFEPTPGGQDIGSALALASYQDYRFRAPNILLLQEAFEHSSWGPFGNKICGSPGSRGS